MNKYEFLTQLEEQLRGFVSNQEVRESVQYYQSYIEEEMRGGRTEEEIFEDIGSANSVAKAIIEAKGHQADGETVYDEADYSYGSNHENYSGGYENGRSDRYSNEDEYGDAGRRGSNVKVFRTDGWKGTAILIGILVIVVLLLSFAFRVMVALLPVIIPFALIVFLIKMVTGRR